ncbi:uncharacterized protein LOC105200996 isoform X2 [Solenopsis invicta]|uniref:uncharacterized protein LOC105200996 isoform X2 n=1 Tax=Solenopsis invicta TaxID=13686 RepID=UPI0005963A23|nr:uncharacterized protein LOC105200996 isoform X2 [Solenopsis invicta]
MPTCCILGCVNRNKKGSKIFMARFPSNPKKKKLWISSIGRTNWEPTINSAKHFASEMWEKIRVDGKQKLKLNAIPTIFSPRDKSGTYITTTDQTNKSLQSQPIFGTFHTDNNEKKYNESLGSDVTSSNLEVSITSHSPEQSNSYDYFAYTSEKKYNDVFDKVKCLEEQLREINKKLDLANKIILKSNKSNNVLKKHIKRLTTMKNNLKHHVSLESALKKIFNDDQLEALTRRSTRGHMWSNDTIKKALRLKFFCGSSGYQQLLKEKIPLPSERTLQRKLEGINFEEGIFNDVFKLSEDKVVSFKDSRKRNCMIALDEMSITPGEQLNSTQSHCGIAFFSTRTGNGTSPRSFSSICDKF